MHNRVCSCFTQPKYIEIYQTDARFKLLVVAHNALTVEQTTMAYKYAIVNKEATWPCGSHIVECHTTKLQAL